jgi:hypothetical protein
MEMSPTANPLNSSTRNPESFTKTTAVVFDPAAAPAMVRANEIVDESLVVDVRSELSPAQLVEDKLTRILGDAAPPTSPLQVRGLLRSR